ncbi:MAG: type II toxin-antitoxin system RelE/ParE family toxin [Deltaproteobacteria bacterium]|nr:type II toxin-antitoxin system RelE/ParE family toxin [Deltaproteobacteria bacterium]
MADLKVPGFNFHVLQGISERYSMHVNGPWCITFEWKEGQCVGIVSFRTSSCKCF